MAGCTHPEELRAYASMLAAQEKAEVVGVVGLQLSVRGIAPNGARFETGDQLTAMFYRPLPVGTALYAHPPAPKGE